MRSFELSRRGACRSAALVAVALVLVGGGARAHAQEQPQGFAVERLYRSAAGAGWLVMDDLSMHGELGGALSLTTGYARDPLRPSAGSERLRLVAHQAFVGFGAALTYDRLRFSLDLDSPLVVKGNDGAIGNHRFTAPTVDLGSNPDTVADPRLGVDARLLGDWSGPFRLGLGAQLLAPNGLRADYLSDQTWRAMGRLLAAGDGERFAWAAHLGVHVRPLDDAPTPGSPRGHELLFGVAAGPRLALAPGTALIVGPELFGETALRALFGRTTTGVEALLSGRLESTSDDASRLRLKLGVGAGLHPEFGAPTWRTVLSLELSDRAR